MCTNEVDDETAIGVPSGGSAKMGLAVREGWGPPEGRSKTAGVGVRVAEVEDGWKMTSLRG